MENNSQNQIQQTKNQFLLKTGNFFFGFRNMIFPAIFVIAFLVLRPHMSFNDPQIDMLLVTLGVVIALSGCALRLAVIGFAYIVRGGKDKKVYADDLVATGFYAHCRNPMYVGNILIASGIVMIYGSLWMAIIILPFFLFVYLAIVTAEENYLQNKFGPKFEEYCNNVPRFTIKFEGLKKSLSGFVYDWQKVLRKEYGTLCSTLAGIVILIGWKMHLVYGIDLGSSQMKSLAWPLLAVAIFYLTVRTLKKSGGLKGIS